MQAHWRAEGPEMVNDGQGKYATTTRDYGNFELLLEYKTVPLADSGIYLRGVPQVQICSSDLSRLLGRRRSGARRANADDRGCVQKRSLRDRRPPSACVRPTTRLPARYR
jgi:hypothetical protein